MKTVGSKTAICDQQLVRAIATDTLNWELSQPYLSGSYLETWFRCLKLSKQYTQNCRTGIFPNDGAYQTYCLFGTVEDCPIRRWWDERGCAQFGCGLTSLRVRLVVKHTKTAAYQIALDVYEDTDLKLAGNEFSLLLDQIRCLNSSQGLLSKAPVSWSIYKSKITCESMKQHLDVFEAHEKLISKSDRGNLWRIGEQLRLNPKAMSKAGDTHNERVEKHKVMGKTVSNMVSKARGLVQNACNGIFPRFKPEEDS